MKLTAAEREWLAQMRARRCKDGHLRHDARLYRNASGSLWLDCVQCVRDRTDEGLLPSKPEQFDRSAAV